MIKNKWPLFLLAIALTSPMAKADIAIIIDDVGYHANDAKLLALPAEITLSVLPHTPYGKKIAEQAHARGQEIMLHLPMESIGGKVLEPGTIYGDMSEADILQTLESALNQLPLAAGVNNHMGSKLTQLTSPMTIIMQVLKQRKLFFVDSRTSSQSVAFNVAQAQGVVAYRRHIFLDNVLDQQAITEQLAKALRMANKKQSVIAIGHPHDETIAALTAFFSTYSAQSIALHKVSSLKPTVFTPVKNNRLAVVNSTVHHAD